MGLQYKLRTNTGEIGSALLSFGESARNMLSVLRGALKDLYSLHEADAVTRLARCESVATEMAHSAGKIEGNFQSLAEEAAAVLRLTSETRNLHRHERPAAQQGQRDINARDESIKATRAALEQQMRRVQTLHQEAKAAQATADGRVSSQSMVSHLAMAFGGGITAEPALTMESLKAGSELGAALAETRTNYPVRNEEETKAPTQDARPLTEEAKKKDAATAKQTYEDETASPGRSAALDAYAATAASYAQEKFKYLDMLMDLQEQEREALNAMAHNALELGAAKDNEEVEDAAVVSLHHAVVTLNQIVVILAERKRILTQMATECARLAKVDLRTVIEGHMKRSREHRIVAYNEPGFQVQLLVVAAQWRALQLVRQRVSIRHPDGVCKDGRNIHKESDHRGSPPTCPNPWNRARPGGHRGNQFAERAIGQRVVEQREQATDIEQAVAGGRPGAAEVQGNCIKLPQVPEVWRDRNRRKRPRFDECRCRPYVRTYRGGTD